jgi:hypothetical protein
MLRRSGHRLRKTPGKLCIHFSHPNVLCMMAQSHSEIFHTSSPPGEPGQIAALMCMPTTCLFRYWPRQTLLHPSHSPTHVSCTSYSLSACSAHALLTCTKTQMHLCAITAQTPALDCMLPHSLTAVCEGFFAAASCRLRPQFPKASRWPWNG